ncbi:hypothetical protein [Klebsiella pneumoniae]|uniref:hypothetical protein n=1 Tax=Klebsiella pneumoniae TaxID=573 RepID=UPI00350EECD9
MKKRIACLLSFLLSLYTCTALARHQQLMHNVYDTQESQSKVNEILSAVSFHGNELSYGERIAEISLPVSSERLIRRIHLLDHL